MDSATGLLTLSSAQFARLQSLFFTIGGTTFEFTANAQIWPRALNATIGGEEGKTCKSYRVETKTELSKLLDDPEFAAAKTIQLVELVMEPTDAPSALKRQAELSGKTNRYVAELPAEQGQGEAA